MIRCSGRDERWQCTVTNGSLEVDADTSTRNGAGEGFRPHELLEAALASCLNMTVRMKAEQMGVDPGTVTTEVELDRDADRTTFVYSMSFEGVTEAEAEAIRDSASRCPVRETLSKELGFEDVGLRVTPGDGLDVNDPR